MRTSSCTCTTSPLVWPWNDGTWTVPQGLKSLATGPQESPKKNRAMVMSSDPGRLPDMERVAPFLKVLVRRQEAEYCCCCWCSGFSTILQIGSPTKDTNNGWIITQTTVVSSILASLNGLHWYLKKMRLVPCLKHKQPAFTHPALLVPMGATSTMQWWTSGCCELFHQPKGTQKTMSNMPVYRLNNKREDPRLDPSDPSELWMNLLVLCYFIQNHLWNIQNAIQISPLHFI